MAKTNRARIYAKVNRHDWFFYLQVHLIRAVLQMTKELLKQRICELSNQIT